MLFFEFSRREDLYELRASLDELTYSPNVDLRRHMSLLKGRVAL
jgi:hypothetical protein